MPMHETTTYQCEGSSSGDVRSQSVARECGAGRCSWKASMGTAEGKGVCNIECVAKCWSTAIASSGMVGGLTMPDADVPAWMQRSVGKLVLVLAERARAIQIVA